AKAPYADTAAAVALNAIVTACAPHADAGTVAIVVAVAVNANEAFAVHAPKSRRSCHNGVRGGLDLEVRRGRRGANANPACRVHGQGSDVGGQPDAATRSGIQRNVSAGSRVRDREVRIVWGAETDPAGLGSGVVPVRDVACLSPCRAGILKDHDGVG